MSAIFGIFHRDGSPVEPEALANLLHSHRHWGPDGGAVQCGEEASACLGLGQARFFSTPEAAAEHLPYFDPLRNLAFTAAGRLDNRADLIAECGGWVEDWLLQTRQTALSDGDLMYLAYLRWGDEAPQHLYGDWAFAAYHAGEQRLFLARDHFGNTALYYYADAHTFAFATDRHALFHLGLPRGDMDELYLAQVLISWPAYHGERTIFTNLKRLPPAHTLTVTPNQLETHLYWRLEDTPLLHLPKRQDYVEAFRDVFDQAVQARLRAPGNSGNIATSLSGGLDSGSVTATAAIFLGTQGKSLDAYTYTPGSDASAYGGQRFADEWPYAREVVELAGNVNHFRVDAAEVGLIESLALTLETQGEPCHAAGNFYWMIAMERAAHAAGSRVFLTGQVGNASISWKGSIFSQPLAFQIRQVGMMKLVKERLKQWAPDPLWRIWQRQRSGRDGVWSASAIHPGFARRLNLLEQRMNDPRERPVRTALAQRLFLQPGRSLGGALHAQMGAAHGLEIRDPTGDARLLAFAFSVPDWVFIDPHTGLDRWLIRAAMQGRLPDTVRLNRKRGRQAGDLVLRLRAEAQQVECALNDCAHGPAADYVNVPHMREIWQLIQTQDSPQALSKAITVLTRGIMAGLFINAG